MVAVSELWNTWKEGFANKDSSKLAELLTDDFQFVGATTGRNETKQDTLDRVNANPRSLAFDNLEVIYENDEVGVVLFDSPSPELGKGKVMAVYTKKDGKFSQARVIRAVV